MFKNKKYLTLFFLGLLNSALVVNASIFESDKMTIPENELNREIVLPRLDTFEVVKNQNVKFTKKLELGLNVGANFTEPIYNPIRMGFDLGYHWEEAQSVHLSFLNHVSGFNNQYVPGIQDKGNDAGSVGDYDFTRAPALKNSFWGYYNLKAYYGKVSLTKRSTMNLSLYTQYGVGFAQFTHKMYPGLSIGIGQKFFFTPNLGFKAELRLQYQGQANPFLGEGQLKNDRFPVPAASNFQDVYRFGTVFESGLVWIF